MKEAEAGLKEALSHKGETQPSSAEASRGVINHAPTEERNRSAYLVGVILVALGGILLLGNFATSWWFSWGRFWLVLLILAGVVILLARRNRRPFGLQIKTP